MISPWFDSPMYTTERNKTDCLQETEGSSRVDVLPTGEGVLIIDEVKVTGLDLLQSYLHVHWVISI